MNIFDNFIKDTEIIGVGALNSTESQPGSLTTKVIEYSFKVFTKASTIVIYSPGFGQNQVQNADAWLKKYCSIRQQIADQIGELSIQ